MDNKRSRNILFFKPPANALFSCTKLSYLRLPSPFSSGSIPFVFAVNAAAVLLPVKTVLLRKLIAPLETIPVITVEELYTQLISNILADRLDKLMVLMGTYQQCRREKIIFPMHCNYGRLSETHIVTKPAALVFAESYLPEKSLEIVFVIVNYPKAFLLRELFNSIEPSHVLPIGMDVRIEKIAVDIKTLTLEFLERDRSTWRAAYV